MAGTTKGRFLLWGMVIMGLLVPILPRVIVPAIAPGGRYADSLQALFRYPVFALGLCLWTVLPFAVLALSARFHLGDAALDSTERYHRTAGIIGAFITGLGLGLFMHVPTKSGGVNFGIVFFPFYNIVAMPLGYWIIRIITERWQGGIES